MNVNKGYFGYGYLFELREFVDFCFVLENMGRSVVSEERSIFFKKMEAKESDDINLLEELFQKLSAAEKYDMFIDEWNICAVLDLWKIVRPHECGDIIIVPHGVKDIGGTKIEDKNDYILVGEFNRFTFNQFNKNNFTALSNTKKKSLRLTLGKFGTPKYIMVKE